MRTRIVSSLIIIVFMFIMLAQTSLEESKQKNSIEKKITDETDIEAGKIIKEKVNGDNASEPAKEQGVEENRIGYSVYNSQPSHHYRKDLPYLVEEDYVGKGIFVSEYISESEVFLGRVLQQTIEKRGKLDDELSFYFTSYARQQLAEVDWELLEENWVCQPYDYFRDYTLTYPYGEPHYQFCYSFFADLEQTEPGKEKVNEVHVRLFVNNKGQIYYIDIRILEASPEKTGTRYYIYTDPLCDDLYAEMVIEAGEKREGLLFDFECHHRRFMYLDQEYVEELGGFFRDGDMAIGAEQLKAVLVDMLESQGANGSKYETQSERIYTIYNAEDFLNADWQAVGKDWIAASEYDCLYFDNVYATGYVMFEYYFYPDFVMMNTREAMAVVVSGNLDVYDGQLCCIGVSAFPITEEEYKSVKTKKEQENKKVLVVDKGKLLTGQEEVNIPIAAYVLESIPIREYEIQSLQIPYQREGINKLWGYTDVAEVADELAMLFYQDIQEEKIGNGRVCSLLTGEAADWPLMLAEDFEEAGWKMNEAYDCYYIRANEVAGTLHLQYYFYPQVISQDQIYKKVLVIDVYLSEQGIEMIKSNQIRMRW